jgi:glycosyltransferase involved in cell wall biosynthesis
LRILFLIDNLRPGGAQKVLLAVLEALERTALEPVVWCLGGSSRIERDFEALGIPVLGKPEGFWELASEPLALMSYLRSHEVVLVQTFLFHSDVMGRVAGLFARRRRPGGRMPIVVSSVRATNLKNRWWQFALQRMTAPLAHAFTAVSRKTLEFAVAHEGVRADRAQVIPNGIDLTPWSQLPDQTTARKELDLPEDGPVIGTLGRLHEQKGHIHLLDAAVRVVEEFPKATFLIAGYGPLEDELKKKADDLGLSENVRFLGYRQDVGRILAALDIFALPSLWEGMSNAVLEAMAAGKCVVATEVDGAVDQVVHDETGLLIPPGDSDALADALLTACKDRAMMEAMGRQGRERAAEVFPLEKMTQTTLDLYARLLQDKGGIAPMSWRA